MLSRSVRCIFSKCRSDIKTRSTKPRYYCTSQNQDGSSPSQSASRDPGPVFLDNNVQRILYKVTGFNLDQIFRARPVLDIEAPAYKLMTDHQLQEAQEEAIRMGRERLQMPPFMKAREDKWEVIADDTEIAGHDVINHVFTDITFGLNERERTMVVREPGGLLRTASWEERNRLQKVYFMPEGRMHHTPQMFNEKYLERMLAQGKHEYVLDRACVQFEPDDPEFLRVTQRTYEHIDSAGLYGCLYSTRHFGGMTFYFTLYRKLEGLLMYKIERDQISDAGDLVRLYTIVHPECPTAQTAKTENVTDDVELIKIFIANDVTKAGPLELALQSYINAHSKKSATS